MYNILFGGRRKKFEVNSAEATYKVHYLGNVMTSLLKRGGGVSGSGGGDTLTKSTSRKVAETKSNSSSISSAKSARLNSISEEDDDDELDDELVDYLECLGAGGVRQDEQLELSCVDKPVRILWDNHLKNSGYYHYVIIISYLYNKINKYIYIFIQLIQVLHKKKCIGNCIKNFYDLEV